MKKEKVFFRHSRYAKKNNAGFTLIELMVVISIISLLANIFVATAYVARIKARDVKRIAQLNQVQKALEIFYDIHGVYPCGDSNGSGGLDQTNWPYGTSDSTYSGKLANGCDNGNGMGGPPDGDCDDIGVDATNCTFPPLGGIFDEGLMHIENLPDPLHPVRSYWYAVDQARQTYFLMAETEQDSINLADDGGHCSCYETGPGITTVDNPSTYNCDNFIYTASGGGNVCDYP
jgi:prepilin-type N-terminal cleavage/methylation domain-containing protein